MQYFYSAIQGLLKSNYIYYKVWNEIIYPFPNLNSVTVEVWECISYFIYT